MKRKRLEMLISSMKDMTEPRPDLEQYRTPSRMVCDILLEAYARGDIENRRICELGCGPAPFVLGSWILGASEVLGVDKDDRAVNVAKENLVKVTSEVDERPKGEVEFMVHDVKDPIPFSPRFHTVFMNPPFGAQMRHADRAFVERAMEISDTCYSIHNGNSQVFLRRMTDAMGVELELLWEDLIEVPARFRFHSKEVSTIEVIVVRMARMG